MNHMFIRMHKK